MEIQVYRDGTTSIIAKDISVSFLTKEFSNECLAKKAIVNYWKSIQPKEIVKSIIIGKGSDEF